MALLEVLLAIALFAAAAAVVGSAMRATLSSATDMRVRAEAVNLAETVFARLATGEIEMAGVDDTVFDEENPVWTYSIVLEPADNEDPALQRVIVTVSNGPEADRPQNFVLTQWIYDASAGAEDNEVAEY